MFSVATVFAETERDSDAPVSIVPTLTLLGRIDNKEIRFRVDREITEVPQALSQYSAVLKNAREIIVRFSPNETNVGQIIEAVQKSKLGIVDVTTDQSDLEDVFLQITSGQ